MSELPINQIICGDSLSIIKTWPDQSVNCCVTSPPYWGLRDYGMDGQMGLEETPEDYVAGMVKLFREVRRVLRDDGTLWLNLGDSYSGSGKGLMGDGTPSDRGEAKQGTNRGTTVGYYPKTQTGLKPKDLVGIPWRVAFALQADGWYLRQDIIWHKPNPMPESVTDRCTKSHEYVFLLSKSAKYYYDAEAVSEKATKPAGSNGNFGNKDAASRMVRKLTGNMKPGVEDLTKPNRNRRSVWTITTKPYSGAHFAVMPPDLVEPCILAGCPEGGVVLDPFMGSGTTAMVAKYNGRNYVGTELNPEYIELSKGRLNQGVLF